MDEGLHGLDEYQDDLASPMKIVVGSTSRMNNSASLMKIALDSVSGMVTRRVGKLCKELGE